MRAVALSAALLLLQGGFDHGGEVDAAPERFHLQRAFSVPANTQGQACALVDAALYAHTGGRLSAMRVYRLASPGAAQTVSGEVPFAFTESGSAGQQEESARLLNLGVAPEGGNFGASKTSRIVFDLAMPQRTYTAVNLALGGHDWIASAKVFGSLTPEGPRTNLGTFALFDLSSQGLSRSTTLPLQEVSFPLLHIELTVSPAPGSTAVFTPEMVTGAQVPPSREAQTLYTAVAETLAFTAKGHETLATLQVPAFVPVERVTFILAPEFTKNFSREVRLSAHPPNPPRPASVLAPRGSRDETPVELVSGTIQRVRLPVNALGEVIQNEQTSIEALLGSNLRNDATVEVAVENQDDAPLSLRAVQLQMRQRKLCFDAEPGANYVLRYGDDAPVRAPVYDYARLFQPEEHAALATLGPEAPNPVLPAQPKPVDAKSYTDRHPELLWVVLLAVVAVLGTIAVRSAKQAGKR